jgi:hypothetical protein
MQKPLKDREREAYFQNLFAMYGTEGWKSTMEDLKKLREVYNDINHLETVEDLWFRKGQIEFIDQLLTHQDRHEQAYANEVEDEQGVAEKPTGGKAKVVLDDIV